MTQATGEEILLNATAMQPPEPLQQAISILQQLRFGQYLRMLHRHLPYPLFESCQQLEISYRHFTGQQSEYIILFWRSDDPSTAKICEKIER
ncbi:MAG: DUF2249 domain-containing protein [Gammaproteobacteria bacterium]|nr:DUF2249 domain-containing protein [Gammaproteobacteria bacterium]MCP4089080.1 DUF2249 domain-containing protein [Gammaproteobacteria bacterium]